MNRREWVQTFLAGGSLTALGGLSACTTIGSAPSSAKVVVVGGGYGGATAAKYIRLLSENTLDVVLVEPSRSFMSCPMSNLVVGGLRQISDITLSYDGLRKNHGISVVHDMVAAIDADRKTVKLANGTADPSPWGFDVWYILPLALNPGQPGGLPSIRHAAVAIGILVTFKPLRHIPAIGVTRLGQGRSRR